ncbi:hypothetical protein CYMTET_34095 [Cymbomonas tetramitiformis]|uniref:Uncharacterized protein n=1 Tax=Cymbomonas tetramitiformis TaxID=36881 RepID=A0AAE0FCC6_9CHLO|nr:hypothetical protein CYMTET_34095 [Cymbomonas tetramitiformis]
MACLTVAGFNQPYQLNTFGDRFFDNRSLGLELSLFYGMEIVGGFYAGRMLDLGKARGESRTAAVRHLFGKVALGLWPGSGNLQGECGTGMREVPDTWQARQRWLAHLEQV